MHQKDDGKWYFWDEAGFHEYGPYESKEECAIARDKYAHNLMPL